MSKRKRTGKKPYWRTLRCERCPKRCQYRTFTPLTGDWTLGRLRPHRDSGQRGGPRRGQLIFSGIKRDLASPSDNRDDWHYRRRGTVLGAMHGEKLRLWESLTASCPEAQDGD